MLRFLNPDFLQFAAVLIFPAGMFASELIMNAQIIRNVFI